MSSYWRERELKHIKKMVKNDKKIAKELRKKYRDTMEDIQKEIDSFYGKYASKEGMTIEQARKHVAKTDVEKYNRKAKKYVKERNFTDKANREMRRHNVSMKINRLELLKQNVNLELIAMYSDEERLLYEEMNKGVKNEYEYRSSILGMTVESSEKHIKSIINSSFKGATWSTVIWKNQKALRKELDNLLQKGIVQGRGSRELARELRTNMGSSAYNAERLMRTEMARAQQDVFEDTMEQTDIEQYEYIAEPDACDICAPLDGQIFRRKDKSIGVNAYPMHPNCRCSQAVYVDRDEWEQKLQEKGL